MQIHLDMYQTLAIAVVVLMLGQFLKQKIMPFLLDLISHIVCVIFYYIHNFYISNVCCYKKCAFKNIFFR